MIQKCRAAPSADKNVVVAKKAYESRPKCELDPYVPMSQVAAFAEEMKNAGADYQPMVYGRTMHGFTHETATGAGARRAL